MKKSLLTLAIGVCLSQGTQADLIDQIKSGNPIGGVGSVLQTQTGGTQDQNTSTPEQTLVDLGNGTNGDTNGMDGGSTADVYTETEPNDSMDAAIPLTPDASFYGTVENESDVDWYRVDARHPGVLMTVRASANRNRMRLSIIDAGGQMIASFRVGETVSAYPVVLPSAGSWFIRVDSVKKGFDYQLSASGDGLAFPGDVGAESTDLMEIEPNDSVEAAQPVDADKFYLAAISGPHDDDYWQFFATEGGDVGLEMSHSGNEVKFELYRKEPGGVLDLIQSFVSQAGRSNVQLPVPSSGMFVLKVSGSDGVYRFKLSGDHLASVSGNRFFQMMASAQREGEPNDNPESADAVLPGTPVSGNLKDESDQDWFVFKSIRAGGLVTIEVPKPPTPWRLRLFDRYGNVIGQLDVENGIVSEFRIPDADVFYVAAENAGNTSGRYVFNLTGEAVQAENGVRSGNFHDVEVEPNDSVSNANPLTSMNIMQGQTQNASDLDLYRIESKGGEILSVTLCPDGSTCARYISDNQGPWAVYVFKDGVDAALNASYPLLDCNGPVANSHPYLLYDKGMLDDYLIGVIDPNFGGGHKIEVGLDRPGVYYIGVSPVLKRDANGDSVIKLNKVCGQDQNGNDIKIDAESIIVKPFVTDPYQLRVAKTHLPPLSAVADGQPVAGGDNIGLWNGQTALLSLPKVIFDGKIYSARLRLISSDGAIRLRLDDAQLLGLAIDATDPEQAASDALTPTFDGGRLHVPVVFAPENGKRFGVDMIVVDQGVFEVEKIVERQ